MLRYLRIAFSVGCAVACLLLIALRVQSHYHADSLEHKTNWRRLQLRSMSGRLEFEAYSVQRQFPGISVQSAQRVLSAYSQGQTFVSRRVVGKPRQRGPLGFLGFGWRSTGFTTTVSAPHWFPILLFALFASLASAPEIQWSKRFSLRTLLLVMTLVALLLGALTYAAR